MDALYSTKWLPSYLEPFISLSYPTETSKDPDSFPHAAYYNTGRSDLCLIITCIVVMAVLRDALRLGVFEPFARWKLSRDLALRKRHQSLHGVAIGKLNGQAKKAENGNGHTTSRNLHGNARELRQVHRSVLRFAEQGWSFVYYSLQSALGFYVHRNLPTRIWDPTDLWRDYPHIPLPGPVKFYYLSQTAFYTHQILILNAEARRKDHFQMMAHHVITVILMTMSYFSNFTRVGCLIMVLMDWCDIFLPLAKMIRYIDISQFACDVTFGFFLISWLITRHVLFVRVIISAIIEVASLVSVSAYIAFCSMLVALQVIQIIWFWMICRIAWRVVMGGGASDDRSDDEE
ncbi:longevity assurance proteins LAG1/LAC1 [Tricholoma matsutake]|nr:longevity assurance proteins LAG1/LAC1 [Tricholoma matsutake 945]